LKTLDEYLLELDESFLRFPLDASIRLLFNEADVRTLDRVD